MKSLNKKSLQSILLTLLAIVLVCNILIIIMLMKFLRTDQLQLIATTTTGLITLLVLFWTLKAYQKNNKILINQNRYKEFYNRITEFEIESKTELYSENEIQVVERVLGIDKKYNYRNISMDLFFILIKIAKTIEDYKTMHFVDESNIIPIDHLSYFDTLSDALRPIRYGLISLEIHNDNMAKLYKEIDMSDLDEPLKGDLLRKFSRITDNYVRFCDNIKAKVYDNLSVYDIMDVKYCVSLIEADNMIFKPVIPFIDNGFFNAYEIISKIHKKYIVPITI